MSLALNDQNFDVLDEQRAEVGEEQGEQCVRNRGKHLSQWDIYLPKGWQIHEYEDDPNLLLLCRGDYESRARESREIDTLIRKAEHAAKVEPLWARAYHLLDQFAPEGRGHRTGPGDHEHYEGWEVVPNVWLTIHCIRHPIDGENWDNKVVVYATWGDKPRGEGDFGAMCFAEVECVDAMRYAHALSQVIQELRRE